MKDILWRIFFYPLALVLAAIMIWAMGGEDQVDDE